jgi:peptidyl-dipeptidase Dcp
MKMKLIYLAMIPMILMASCAAPEEENPFFSEFNTPFGVPPFEEITNAHFVPAIEEGMMLREAEIDAIVNTPEAPTFENTILALEYSGRML